MSEKVPRGFREDAESDVTAVEAYRKLKVEGVAMIDIFLFLRDEYSLSLLECKATADKSEQSSANDT